MSCLFNSISYFINENGNDIRNKVCDYLENNSPIIDGVETHKIIEYEHPSAINYIQNMRSTKTMGGAIEIQAACNIWKISINVHNYRDVDNKIIQFLPISKLYDKVIDIYWTGGHYEPIRSKRH
jgi:hypothetical protein